MLTLLATLMGILMSGVLVAWRRLDTSPSSGRHGPFYQTQAFEDDLAAEQQPYKTLVLYIYHESDSVTRENLDFFLKVSKCMYVCMCV